MIQSKPHHTRYDKFKQNYANFTSCIWLVLRKRNIHIEVDIVKNHYVLGFFEPIPVNIQHIGCNKQHSYHTKPIE